LIALMQDQAMQLGQNGHTRRSPQQYSGRS
jgi:hypothetical protein